VTGDLETRRRSIAILCLKGGAAGVTVGVAALLLLLWARSRCEGLECLWILLVTLAFVLLLAPVLAWVILRLLRVERALGVALGGTVTTYFLSAVGPASVVSPVLAVTMLLALAAAGYGGSAVVLSRWTPRWAKWMYATVLALYVAVAVVSTTILLRA
jgi:hypothetical protein